MQSRPKKIALHFISALIITTISSVFVADEPPVLSHAGHLNEYGAACDTCHDPRHPEKLKPEGCTDCHEGRMEKVRLNAHAREGTIRFSHTRHEAAAECLDCHRATANDQQKQGEEIQSFEACRDCHDAYGIELATQNCAVCHKKSIKTTRPSDHRNNWLPRHGKQAEWSGQSGHGRDCYLCHSRSDCKTCHKTQKPRSHTALFRIRTHGRIASFDRDRCKTCHETGACINCHRHNPPMTHRGAWTRVHGISAAVNSERCRACHGPTAGAGTSCAACHRGQR